MSGGYDRDTAPVVRAAPPPSPPTRWIVRELDAVEDCAAVAVPDAVRGEEVKIYASDGMMPAPPTWR